MLMLMLMLMFWTRALTSCTDCLVTKVVRCWRQPKTLPKTTMLATWTHRTTKKRVKASVQASRRARRREWRSEKEGARRRSRRQESDHDANLRDYKNGEDALRLQHRDRDGMEGGAGSPEKRRCRVISTSRKQRSIQLLSGEIRHCGGSAAVHVESFTDSGRTSGDLATRLLPDWVAMTRTIFRWIRQRRRTSIDMSDI